MALDFTGIPDRPGSVAYFICNGTPQGEQKFRDIMDELKDLTEKQIVWLGDTHSDDAAKLIDFYDLKGIEMILIIRDDDQLHHVWSDGERMDAGQIAYVLNRAG